MRKKLSRFIPLLVLLVPPVLSAQPLLTLDEAIKAAMEKNYTVLRATNEEAIARNNYTLGNAGFLPSVDLTAGTSGALNNARQRYTNGDIIDRSGSGSSNLNTGIGLNWTIFDGFRMFHRYDALQAEQALGEASTRVVVESTTELVVRAYYDIVQQQRVLKVLREAVGVSDDRVNNAQLKYEVGENSKREILQARVDLNTDRSAVLRQEVSLANAKATLNQMMVRPVETDFTVADTIIVATDLDYDSLKTKALANNKQLQVAQINENLAEYTLQDVQSQRYPRVGLALGYNLSQAETETGQILSNRNSGLSYGLTASMNIFNGFNTNREAENARIDIASSELESAELRQQIETDLLRAYKNYRNRLALVALEGDNVELAKENLDIALDRFRFGAIIPLELREAQTGYVAAESRLVTAQYEAKLAEIELRRLSGELAP